MDVESSFKIRYAWLLHAQDHRAVAPSPAGLAMAGPVSKKLTLLVRSNPA